MGLFRKRLVYIFTILAMCLIYVAINREVLSLEKTEMMKQQDKRTSTSALKTDIFMVDTLKIIMPSSEIDPTTRHALQDDSGKFHVVTNFVPFTSKELRKKLLIDGKPPTDQQLEERMSEVLECLQKNLNNNKIANVHVLVFGEETITYLQSLQLQNSRKLILYKNDNWPTILDQLIYASNYLQGRMVVMCHQDNYIGEGWEKVNHTVLKRERLMYALTRHPSPSKCNGTTTATNCGEGYPYVGSHDAFVFFVNETIDRQKLAELDVTPNINGMENVLMWVYKTRLNYRILNPCKVLFIYHMHCIPIRETGRQRINNGGKSAWVPYTNQLQ